MYLRKSKKKNGRVYLTIVEAYRDERGKNMSRTVESLGYVDDLERSGIADPIGHFTEECARRNEARRAGTEPVIVKIGPLQRIDKRDGVEALGRRGAGGALGRRWAPPRREPLDLRLPHRPDRRPRRGGRHRPDAPGRVQGQGARDHGVREETEELRRTTS